MMNFNVIAFDGEKTADAVVREYLDVILTPIIDSGNSYDGDLMLLYCGSGIQASEIRLTVTGLSAVRVVKGQQLRYQVTTGSKKELKLHLGVLILIACSELEAKAEGL